MQDFHATQEFRGVTSQATDALSITIDSLAPGNITSTLPNYAQVGQAYDVDIDSKYFYDIMTNQSYFK